MLPSKQTERISTARTSHPTRSGHDSAPPPAERKETTDAAGHTPARASPGADRLAGRPASPRRPPRQMDPANYGRPPPRPPPTPRPDPDHRPSRLEQGPQCHPAPTRRTPPHHPRRHRQARRRLHPHATRAIPAPPRCGAEPLEPRTPGPAATAELGTEPGPPASLLGSARQPSCLQRRHRARSPASPAGRFIAPCRLGCGPLCPAARPFAPSLGGRAEGVSNRHPAAGVSHRAPARRVNQLVADLGIDRHHTHTSTANWQRRIMRPR
jgi:hypothetical protein